MQFKCRDPKQNLELTSFEHCMSSIIAVTSACLGFLYSKCRCSEKQHFERMQTELFSLPVSKHHSVCVQTLQKILKSGDSCYATLNKKQTLLSQRRFPCLLCHSSSPHKPSYRPVKTFEKVVNTAKLPKNRKLHWCI